MIRVDVKEYCHQCLDFHPDVIPPVNNWSARDDDERTTVGDTVIKCKYRKRCSGMMRYLEKQAKSKVSE